MLLSSFDKESTRAEAISQCSLAVFCRSRSLVSAAAASPGEVTLVDQTLAAIVVPRQGPGRPRQKPDRLIGDKAYDSDPLRTRLAQRGIELMSPHRTNRVKAPTQDGRALRRYRRRWKIERLFAWLGHYRRLVIRYEYLPEMYGAFFHVACAMIVLRHL